MSRRKFEEIQSGSGAKIEIRTENFGADICSQEGLYIYIYIYISVRFRYGRPHRLSVQISIRSPSYGAGEGASPSQRTPAASPTTFPPRRVRRIPVFQSDHPKLQTKSIWLENWNSANSLRMESGRGSSWSPLGWRRALTGAVRWRKKGHPHFKSPANVRT
ncbi:hypothetical protein ACLB2K_054860 [Fragaria x ananassa]